MSLDGENITPLPTIPGASSLAVDEINNRLHYGHGGAGDIRRVNFDGTQDEPVAKGVSSPFAITDLEVDSAAGKLYWSDTVVGFKGVGPAAIYELDLDSGEVSSLFDAPPGTFLNGIDFHSSRPACPGDLDGDNDVGLSDLGALLADFGCAPPQACDADLNSDGAVDLSDLGLLLANFGDVCGM